MANTLRSGRSARKGLRVQVPPSAPKWNSKVFGRPNYGRRKAPPTVLGQKRKILIIGFLKQKTAEMLIFCFCLTFIDIYAMLD